jgi:enolase
MMNIINGGRHAAGSTDIQEFMILPHVNKNFAKSLQMCTEVFHDLGQVLKTKNYTQLVGDEGGYAPAVEGGNSEALDLIIEAIQQAGYEAGKDIMLALDVAASELYKNGKYYLATENKRLDNTQMTSWYDSLVNKFPIVSIEDGLNQNDWLGWNAMTRQLGGKVRLVGDDLLVTNTKLLRRAMQVQAANAILIKPNQIGTLTETIDAAVLAKKAGWRVIVSHRSGETEDTSIAHLAVGLGTGFIKAGAPSRGERTAKYNELLRIEEQLTNADKYRV